MGYYTRFELSWDSPSSVTQPCPHCEGVGRIIVADAIKTFVEEEKFCYEGTHPINSNLQGEKVKWYDHEKDMREVSRRFPGVLFTLRGEGEESGDLWVKYFKDGKMQVEKLKVDLPGFDPKKLTE